MTTTTRYYAISLRNWVEIRSAAKAPTQVTGIVTAKAKRREYYMKADLTRGYRMIEEKRDIAITNFIGGKVIETLSAVAFAYKTGRIMRSNTMIELTAHELTRLGVKK